MTTALMTDDFPYTVGYVLELLGLTESGLESLTKHLNIVPKKDSESGKALFTHMDINCLKKAIEMKKQGVSIDDIVRHLAYEKNTQSSALESSVQARQGGASQARIARPSLSSSQSTGGVQGSQDNITLMVEAVSQVKEGILKDLSRLLDDKLAGLDEVVIELIRCKSENDSLKKRIQEEKQANASLEQELARFKPVQFGFYRKT